MLNLECWIVIANCWLVPKLGDEGNLWRFSVDGLDIPRRGVLSSFALLERIAPLNLCWDFMFFRGRKATACISEECMRKR